MRGALLLALLSVLFASVFSALFSQQVTGTIKGLVTDPSGVVVANASVDVTNKATASHSFTENRTGSAGVCNFEQRSITDSPTIAPRSCGAFKSFASICGGKYA